MVNDSSRNPLAPPKTVECLKASPGQQIVSTPARIEPQKGRQIVTILAKLASHPNFTPYADLSPAQFDQMAFEMACDLQPFGVTEIESAVISYRQDPKARGFPSSGKLLEILGRERKDRAAASRPKVLMLSRPNGWWYQPVDTWKPDWREIEVPDGELVRSTRGAALRQPKRSY